MCLAHRNCDAIMQLISKDFAIGMKENVSKNDTICECYIKGKLIDSPYPKTAKFITSRCQILVHTAIVAPL